MSKSLSNERLSRGCSRVVLSLGSNIGLREQNILGAVSRLGRESGIELSRLSSCYETEPVGRNFSRTFINAACIIRTNLEPGELLRTCKGLEREYGREEKTAGGDRSLDIDIILYGDRVISGPELEIPHPRLRERMFVMVPLAEIAGDIGIPPDGVRLNKILGDFSGVGWVRKISARGEIR